MTVRDLGFTFVVGGFKSRVLSRSGYPGSHELCYADNSSAVSHQFMSIGKGWRKGNSIVKLLLFISL